MRMTLKSFYNFLNFLTVIELCDSFLKSYTTLTWQGEVVDLSPVSESECQHSNIHFEDLMKDMIRDIE